MKVIHFQDVEYKAFEGENVKEVKGRVLIGKADGASHFCMRFFELAPGGFTPRHQHDWEHEIFIHKGHGVALKEGKWVPVESGVAIFVPGGEEHQIRNTGSEPLLFVCLIPSGPPEL
ncbi:MAG: cupin domain-containing protein [Caldiserica bacterium]|nr:cupin domain-containing protein [Caldisericota bacterium]